MRASPPKMKKAADDWREIPDFPHYQINAEGAIRSKERGRHVQQVKDATGNWTARLLDEFGRTSKIRRTSYLVASTFHPEGHPRMSYARCKLYLVHYDGNPDNLSADNVNWYQAIDPGDPIRPDDDPTGYEPDYPEIWRIYAENAKYTVSNYGRVRSRGVRHRILQTYTSGSGQLLVVLRQADGRTTTKQVNHIVAETFVPHDQHPRAIKPRGKNEVCDNVWHIDGDLTNCRADNLLWETRSRVIEWNKQNRPDFDIKIHKPDGTEYARYRYSKESGKAYRSMEELAKEEGVLLSDVKYVYYSLADRYRDSEQIYTIV